MTGAEGVRWDLTPLAPSEQAMKDRLERGVADAAAFVERWRAETIAAVEPAGLAELLRELAELRATRTEGEWWAFLLVQADSENPATFDVQAWVDSRLPHFDEAIRHFENGWLELADDRAETLALDESVGHDRHYLLSLRRFRPFLLSPAEERVLAAREASASTAWKSLYSHTLGALAARFDDGGGERTWPLSELQLARATHPQRDVRRRATAATQTLLEPVLPVLAQCWDAVLADHISLDALRGHADPMEPRNLENEIEASVVEGLLSAAEAHYDLGHRWFRVKARLLGVERLDTIDRVAPVLETSPVSWDEGQRLAVEVFADLAPALGVAAEAFFRERRIDAELRRGKRLGFFSISPSTRVPGFILVSWTGQLRSLVALTHELGHGTHLALAAKAQSDNSFNPGLTIAEVPSTFAQLLLVDQMLASDHELGRAALVSALDDAVINLFMSTAFARSERAAYGLRAEGQALTHERLSDLFDAEMAKVWGEAMSDELGFRKLTWAGAPFIYWRFYTYAYVFAFLVAAGLLSRSREPGFGARYERFLSAGGSDSPEALLRILGVDLRDPGLWDEGFAVIESWLDTMST